MAERTKKSVERATATDAETPPVADSARTSDKRTRLSDDIDSILDEIDDVLEANAEDFVRNYVQKGGE
jgi:ubiquitin-like protein Pup